MIAAAPPLNDSLQPEAVDVPPPRRNLTEAFEELFDGQGGPSEQALQSPPPPRIITQKSETQQQHNLISPTGVADLIVSWKGLHLHSILQRELSQALVDRVSFYEIIHDINKECTAMAAADPLDTVAAAEEISALVTAVIGLTAIDSDATAVTVAESISPRSVCLDEEEWLLSVISGRSAQEVRSCPATFLQAMGEKEYENPMASLAGGSRTQLWKPSRSWWEAKSGKNPWIEPNSHNKRWRYLWPLIHYHKFLAKCIKKLKRNGVDVKQSVSPVAVFLREEVCAVSDHLAGVSLFGSDEWMECLQHFRGWTDTSPESEEHLRTMVNSLKLRALAEPGDVESPLLRNQIDELFLRTMAAARAELREKVEPGCTKVKRQAASHEGRVPSAGPPPMYPRAKGSPPAHPVPAQVMSGQPAAGGMCRPRWGYPPPHGGHWGYHHPGYEQQQPYAGDNSSVQSGLSLDSYHQHYPDYVMYPPQGHMHYPYNPGGPPPPFPAPSDHSQSSAGYEQPVFDPTHGWFDPAMAYAMHQQAESSGYYAPRPTPSPGMGYPDQSAREWQGQANYSPTEHSPYKYDPNVMQPHSPYWAHLDRATLAMGLATPAKASPSTPRRHGKPDDKRDDLEGGEGEKTDSGEENGFAVNAQPPLLRHNQYYGYGPYGGAATEGGYGPPSPATQFMMSPQANFAYNYGYGFSPGRVDARSTPRQNKRTPVKVNTPTAATTDNLTPPHAVHKAVPDRESPSTVETTTETESLAEPANVETF